MATWSPTQNIFNNATKRSTRKMLVLTNDHINKLKAEDADATIKQLYLRTEPLHEDFVQKYADRTNAKGRYKGATLRVKKLLTELRQIKVKQWDVQIQNHYLHGTAEYTGLMPERRNAFQSFGTDRRITNIKALGGSLTAYPAMGAIKADVEAFHTLIFQARDQQQQAEERVAHSAKELEQARMALATIMYQNLGVLMDKYGENVSIIGNFWELRLLQQ